jgi:ATP-dependent RNA helicase DHX37/DHR1
MSATLRITDFTENRKLFKTPPPVIKIESRQYPVSVHFSKYTPQDYIKEAFKKICKIHKDYPDGGILVFVTGRKEVTLLMSKLKRAFPQKAIEKPNDESAVEPTKTKDKKTVDRDEDDELDEEDDIEEEFLHPKKSSVKKNNLYRNKKPEKVPKPEKRLQDLMPSIDLDTIGRSDTKHADAFDSDSDYVASDDEQEEDGGEQMFKEPLYCLPLYSMLPEREQAKVFEPAPAGIRLCVIATNVAETSLTIPNIKYVIDTGKIKNKLFDKYTGISAHVVEWCAKSSADQRAGRSGRTAPGHCFRLYSSAVYNHDFKEFPEAEILKKPLDDLILQLKSMHIEVIRNFPFPTAPDLSNIDATEKRLLLMGALENRLNFNSSGKTIESNKTSFTPIISSLGKLITNFPVSPRYGKMLAVALQQGLIDHMITIVACLTVQEMFLYYVPEEKPEAEKTAETDPEVKTTVPVQETKEESPLERKWKEINSIRRKWLGSGNQLYLGDVMLMLKAVQVCESKRNQAVFCEQLGIRHKSMVEIHKLRKQLIAEIAVSFSNYEVNDDLQSVPTPSDDQCKKLRQLMLLGFCDRVARVLPSSELTSSDDAKRLKNAYKSIELDASVFLNDKCMLKQHRPEWVVYQEIYEHKKMYMRTVVAIEEEWIAVYASNLCKFSKPLETPAARYDAIADQIKCHVIPTFGPFSWPLKKTEIEFPECNEKYKLFARSLLQGQVFTSLESYTTDYITSPAIMSKEWSKLHEHSNLILSALIGKRVSSKSALKKEFENRPSCKLSLL